MKVKRELESISTGNHLKSIYLYSYDKINITYSVYSNFVQILSLKKKDDKFYICCNGNDYYCINKDGLLDEKKFVAVLETMVKIN